MPEVGVEIPKGGIILWSGKIADIPSGWFLCDGNNGTPNLSGRFVIHADADSEGTNDVGDTGGADTIDVSHNHNLPAPGSWGGSVYHRAVGWNATTIVQDNFDYGSNTQEVTNSAGSSTQAIKPKFYALAYIMKT